MLRQQGGDLDTLMRGLWVKSKGGTISEADIYALLNQQGHANVATQLAHWVHSTEDLPVHALLSHYGVAVAAKSGTLAQRLGMRVVERDGIRITHVARGGAGEQAGMAAGDEWVTLFDGTDQWRVKSLSDVGEHCETPRRRSPAPIGCRCRARWPHVVVPPSSGHRPTPTRSPNWW